MGTGTPTNGKPIAPGYERVTSSAAEGVHVNFVICYYRGPGVVILVLSWIITLYTLWQMIEMHEMVPGKRFDRYHELGQHAFGEKLGLWLVVPQQLICQVSVDIVYMVTGGKSLQKIHDLVCKDKNCKQMKTTYFIMIFGSVHFVLSHLPNLNAISGISLAAAIMSLSDDSGSGNDNNDVVVVVMPTVTVVAVLTTVVVAVPVVIVAVLVVIVVAKSVVVVTLPVVMVAALVVVIVVVVVVMTMVVVMTLVMVVAMLVVVVVVTAMMVVAMLVVVVVVVAMMMVVVVPVVVVAVVVVVVTVVAEMVVAVVVR
ncbi:Lysine histidine transporter 2 [Spatholobus suberectus]|nr:Lysine histidine transporter 2 [Spatholobus suberectus]